MFDPKAPNYLDSIQEKLGFIKRFNADLLFYRTVTRLLIPQMRN